VRKILSETRLEAAYLELELTEGVLMDDPEAMAAVLVELKDIGVRLAVDDFGTGYSSLSYLQRFPIDVLKIDQSFVHQRACISGQSTILNAMINIGRGLEYVVVAEGIETHEQRAYLQTQLCAEGQGYLFSRPLPAVDFACLLQAGVSNENFSCTPPR
jgi:EAL domain-containing protein (putative c-di-GMP-specific phosphodiesterase class I)